MARLEGTSTAPDTTNILLSAWVLIPNLSVPGEDPPDYRAGHILSFGSFETITFYNSAVDGVVQEPSDYTFLPNSFGVTVFSDETALPYLTLRGSGGSYNHHYVAEDLDVALTPVLEFTPESTTISLGVWHHLCISLSIGSGTSIPIISGFDGDDFGSIACRCQFYLDGANVVDWVGSASVSAGGNFTEEAGGGGTGDFPIAMTGSVCSVHGRIYNPASLAEIWQNPRILLSEVQAWFNVAPDLTSAISKFISSGKPVDPSIPRAAYGAPYCLFSRSKRARKAFETNQGNGGVFTKVGTLTDSLSDPF